MKLIADSGSTNTEWRLLSSGSARSYSGNGINPFFVEEDLILKEIESLGLLEFKNSITEIHFYGAGLAIREVKEIIHKLLRISFGEDVRIFVNDDILAASRALFHKESGISCILGTGSNSSLYIEGKIIDKIPALGYILGDEGSGSDIGKRLINALLKKDISENLRKKILKEKSLSIEDILLNVYKKPQPNKYLASFSTIVNDYIHEDEIKDIVYSAFKSFLRKNISKYKNYKSYNIGFIGSIAFHFRDILTEVMKDEGLELYKILDKPADELAAYHANN